MFGHESHEVLLSLSLTHTLFLSYCLHHSPESFEKIRRKVSVSGYQRLVYIVQMWNGVTYMHELFFFSYSLYPVTLMILISCFRNNFVHRDLKPDNLLLDPDTGEVVISDMGFAFAFSEAEALKVFFLLGGQISCVFFVADVCSEQCSHRHSRVHGTRVYAYWETPQRLRCSLRWVVFDGCTLQSRATRRFCYSCGGLSK